MSLSSASAPDFVSISGQVAPRDWSVFVGRAHLVGVCGSGMKALAEWLLDRGWSVSGSDLQTASSAAESLQRRGVQLSIGHTVEHLPAAVDLLVYSPAVPDVNPERMAARQQGIPELSYPAMLGALQRSKTGICIAGTHGKSTTTALVGTILSTAGLAPSTLLGAEVLERQANGWAGSGPHVVVESCEYRQHFLELNPQFAAILGIELDHFDCFADLHETVAAFQGFARRVPASGRLIVSVEQAANFTPEEGISALVETIGEESSPAVWRFGNVRLTEQGTAFRILHDETYVDFELRIPGRHHVANAVAAIALARHVGCDWPAIQQGVLSFRGLRRRFECVEVQFVPNQPPVTLVDDYAHHPTAIQATLRTAREQFGGRRLVCLFQPHQISRTRGLFREFSQSFHDADWVGITDIFGAREGADPELSELSRQLAAAIAREREAANRVAKTSSDDSTGSATPVHFCGSLDRAFASLDDAIRPGDVVLTLGAGDIDRIHHALTRGLSRHYPQG